MIDVTRMFEQMGIPDIVLQPLSITGKRPCPAKERAAYYNAAYAKAPLTVVGNRIEGMWLMGNSYGNKTSYYGSYPGNFLQRVDALFPDALSTLHLFSGSLPPGQYLRFDRRHPGDLAEGESFLFETETFETRKDSFENGLIRGEAEHLSEYFLPSSIDLIVADPPYSAEDAGHYGAPMVNRNHVIAEARKILCDAGCLVWLDQVWPMYSKKQWNLIALIGVVISTNHRMRLLTILEKR